MEMKQWSVSRRWRRVAEDAFQVRDRWVWMMISKTHSWKRLVRFAMQIPKGSPAVPSPILRHRRCHHQVRVALFLAALRFALSGYIFVHLVAHHPSLPYRRPPLQGVSWRVVQRVVFAGLHLQLEDFAMQLAVSNWTTVGSPRLHPGSQRVLVAVFWTSVPSCSLLLTPANDYTGVENWARYWRQAILIVHFGKQSASATRFPSRQLLSWMFSRPLNASFFSSSCSMARQTQPVFRKECMHCIAGAGQAKHPRLVKALPAAGSYAAKRCDGRKTTSGEDRQPS